MPHIPRDKFTRWNRSIHSIPLSPLRFNILRRAARFTVLLIRQRQLVSKDTLYINFGYCRREGGGRVVHRRLFSADAVQPLPVQPAASFVVLRFLGYSEGDFPVDSGQHGVELSSDMSRAPSGAGKARRGMSYWRRSRLDLKGWHGTLSFDFRRRSARFAWIRFDGY